VIKTHHGKTITLKLRDKGKIKTSEKKKTITWVIMGIRYSVFGIRYSVCERHA
jgi:hypothetical protein